MFNLNPLSIEGKSIELTTLLRILLPIGFVAILIGLYFAFRTKSKRAVFVTKITMACVLITLFVFKLAFWIVRLIHISPDNTFNIVYLPKALGLDSVSAIQTFLIIFAIVVLLWSAFAKKQNRILVFFEQTLLGIGLPLGVLSIFKLDMIDIYDNLYHMLNIQAIVFRLALVLIPLYLIKTKELVPQKNKFWLAIAGYICLTAICMTLSLMIKNTNLSEMVYASTLNRLGIKIGFPWHLLVCIPAFLIICFGIYVVIEFVYKKLNKTKQEDFDRPKSEFLELYSFATKSICCMQGFLIIIFLAAITRNPLGTMHGVWCLVPLIMTIFCVLTSFEMEKQSANYDESIFDKGNKDAKKIIAYSIMANPLFGLTLLKQFKNERESIEYRKQREAKRLKKEQENGKI